MPDQHLFISEFTDSSLIVHYITRCHPNNVHLEKRGSWKPGALAHYSRTADGDLFYQQFHLWYFYDALNDKSPVPRGFCFITFQILSALQTSIDIVFVVQAWIMPRIAASWQQSWEYGGKDQGCRLVPYGCWTKTRGGVGLNPPKSSICS